MDMWVNIFYLLFMVFVNYFAITAYDVMNLIRSASSKATSKELERIDNLFYSYANGSSAMIE